MLLIAGGATGYTAASNRQAAQRDAEVLLHRIWLPAHSIPSAQVPAGAGSSLSTPATTIPTPDLVDVHAWWSAPGSMGAVFAFVKAHAPQGGTLSSFGSGSQYGKTTERWIVFSWPAVRDVLFQRQVAVEIVPLSGGFAGVRADAQIMWTLPRPPGERVPSSARVLRVTRSALAGWPPPLALTVTDRAQIRALARMLDRLEIVQDVAIACPALFPAPMVTFTFRAQADGPMLARARMASDGPAGECSPISFSVGGHRRPALLAFPAFLRKAGHLLGVTLGTG